MSDLRPNDPIILMDYSPEWPGEAAREIARIRAGIPAGTWEQIEHIGSTAVLGCRAKPIIDVAIQVSRIENGHPAVSALESLGYVFWKENPDTTHLYFVKGMPPYGERRTHHVHFFESARFFEHVRFRDILRDDPRVLGEYQTLKNELAEKFRDDREAYTDGKGEFIRRALDRSVS